MTIIKLIFAPLNWSVNLMLYFLTALVWVGTMGVIITKIIFTPLTWLIIKLAKIIKKRIEHYKNKDSWKEYYDK